MNVIERNNIKLGGEGEQTIVFAHGYGCSQHVWRNVAPHFQHHYRTLLFDHVGSGNSTTAAYDKLKYGSLEGYADDLVEICNELDIENAIFVGHSVGAMIGVLASIKNPKMFSKLVLVGPSPCYINVDDYRGGFEATSIRSLLEAVEANFGQWAESMAPIIMGNSSRPKLSQELMESFCSIRPEIAKHFAQVTFTGDNRSDLKKITVPTLVLQCSDDPIASEVVGNFVHQQIPISSYVKLSATGHCPHMSEPEETAQAIQKFLSRFESEKISS